MEFVERALLGITASTDISLKSIRQRALRLLVPSARQYLHSGDILESIINASIPPPRPGNVTNVKDNIKTKEL